MKYKILRATKCYFSPGDIIHIFDTENKTVVREDDPNYLQWINDGNSPDDEDTEGVERHRRRKQVRALKNKIKNGEALTAVEKKKLYLALLDLLL